VSPHSLVCSSLTHSRRPFNFASNRRIWISNFACNNFMNMRVIGKHREREKEREREREREAEQTCRTVRGLAKALECRKGAKRFQTDDFYPFYPFLSLSPCLVCEIGTSNTLRWPATEIPRHHQWSHIFQFLDVDSKSTFENQNICEHFQAGARQSSMKQEYLQTAYSWHVFCIHKKGDASHSQTRLKPLNAH